MIVPFRPHVARASTGEGGCRSANSAKEFNVIEWHPRSAASRASARQRAGGMPRSRHPLTVESAKERADATALVPPRLSMTEAGVEAGADVAAVSIPPMIVCRLRTCQGFATRETTFPEGHGPIRAMIDPPKIIGARLRALRRAVGCPTQVAFANSIGVEKNTYNPWEKGQRPLTFEGALLIRKRYRVPLDYLFFGEAMDELPAGILNKLQEAA